MRSRRGPLLGLVPMLAAGMLAGGCVDPATGAEGSCAAQDVGQLRCREIVNEAGARLPDGGAPIIGAEVRMPALADRDTLREQQLVATVRFSFLDGSAVEVPVFCAPRLADTLVCKEPAP
jgi:hypothetical protein